MSDPKEIPMGSKMEHVKDFSGPPGPFPIWALTLCLAIMLWAISFKLAMPWIAGTALVFLLIGLAGGAWMLYLSHQGPVKESVADLARKVFFFPLYALLLGNACCFLFLGWNQFFGAI